MLHRSTSSRRRRASRSAASSPQTRPSRSTTTSPGRRASIAVSPVDSERASRNSLAPEMNRSPRHSIIPDISLDFQSTRDELYIPEHASSRSPRHSLAPDIALSPRNSLVPDISRSPRHSLVPNDSYSRSPRNSLIPDSAMSPRNSLVPDAFSRSPRNSLVPDINKSPRNSLVPDSNRSPRHSLIPADNNQYSSRISLAPEFNRSPRCSLTPDSNRTPRASLTPSESTTWNNHEQDIGNSGINRSPRHSIVPPEGNRSPRGSIAPESLCVRTSPRGSIASEYTGERDRSPRGSIGVDSNENRSPRGSLARSTLQADECGRSPRGSLTLTFQEPPAQGRRASADNPFGHKGRTSPYRSASRGTMNMGYSGNSGYSESGSRRASSSVSQVGLPQVSGDEQRRLCSDHKHSSAAEQGLGLGISLTTYGSVAYQLKDANLESSGTCDFVCKALSIVNKTGSYDLDEVKSIQWGRQHEADGLRAYEEIAKVQVKATGLWLHENGIIGASPDGLIETETLIEIKCPFTNRDKKLKGCLTSDDIFHFNNKNEMILNISHDYYHQIQGQLYITKRKYCILGVWTSCDFVHLTIEKDLEWEKNLEVLNSFYFNKYIPYLLTN